MRQPKNISDFNKLNHRQKVKWIRSKVNQPNTPVFGGVIVDKHLDIIVTYRLEPGGLIENVQVVKLSDELDKAGREVLAEMGTGSERNN